MLSVIAFIEQQIQEFYGRIGVAIEYLTHIENHDNQGALKMVKEYLCPICLTQQSKSKRRRVFSQDSCTNCENFVRAMNRTYFDWLNPLTIQSRVMVNPRHPYISDALSRKILKGLRLYGEITNEDQIVDALQNIRAALYSLLDMEIRKFEQYQLLTDTLNMLDRLYMERLLTMGQFARSMELSISDHAEINILSNFHFGVMGKALERIVECALSYEGFARNGRRYTLGDMFWMLEVAAEIVLVNQVIEEVKCLWHRGVLKVAKDGWKWQLMDQDQSCHDKMVKGWSLDDVQHDREAFRDNADALDGDQFIKAYKELNDQTVITGHSKLNYDEEELIVTINSIHREVFGHKYSEKLLALLALPHLPKKLNRDWIFEDEIITFLNDQLNLPNDVAISVLDSLSLTGNKIRSENANPLEFRRVFRLIRRPLARIELGNRRVYYFSVPFMFRSFLHIRAEYYNNSYPDLKGTPIEKKIYALKQQYAGHFVRERVFPIFNQNRFPTQIHTKQIGQIDLKKECGEIDVLSFNERKNELIVGECKHRSVKELHVSQIRNEIYRFCNTTDGYVLTLKQKTAWVKDHMQEVLSYMGVDADYRLVKCTPIIITNLYCPASEFVTEIECITERQVEAWCKK